MGMSNRFHKLSCEKERKLEMILDEYGCKYLEHILARYSNDEDRNKDSKQYVFAQHILEYLR